MKFLKLICAAVMSATAFTSCAQTTEREDNNMNDKKILVAYFSRADENYSVGYITEGNTQIIAEMIADELGVDKFHIETVEPYPADYNECIAQAKTEKQQGARPAIKGGINVEDYDIIFIGTPNWWGEVPMALYTFIEKHDWNGKTVIPFATHEGSGMGGMDKHILNACTGATTQPYFEIYGHEAQNNRTSAKQKVQKWLKGLSL